MLKLTGRGFFRRGIILLKKGCQDFPNKHFPPSEVGMFSCDNFERFLTLKQIFWKMKTLFKKMESRFLVESTNIENASFS